MLGGVSCRPWSLSADKSARRCVADGGRRQNPECSTFPRSSFRRDRTTLPVLAFAQCRVFPRTRRTSALRGEHISPDLKVPRSQDRFPVSRGVLTLRKSASPAKTLLSGG